MNTIYESAVELKKHGLGVIPLGFKSKRPALTTWAEYQQRRPDASELFEWFNNGQPSNLAIVTGWVSGGGDGLSLVVLDFDDPEVYKRWGKKHLALVNSTWVAKTGGGGYHVFLRLPGPVKTGKMPGGDVKGEGGYVVCPPSIHPDGPAYEWANKPDKIAEVDSLAGLIELPAPARRPTVTTGELPVDRIPDGQRNSTLTSLAGSMRQRGMGEAAILAALESDNLARCDPPLAAAEVRRIAQSVGRYEPAPRPNVASFFDGKTFIPPLLGAHLRRRRPFKNITNVRSEGSLYSYSDGVFRRDGDVAVEQLAAETLGPAFRDNRRAETAAWIRATTYTDPDLANKHPHLVNVANGMLAWETGELIPHDPEHLSTIQIPVTYDPAAMCPEIDEFLLTTLPADCIDLALEWFGYCLTLTAKHCKSLMVTGPASNGKSTFLGLLGAFVGQDNTTNIPLHELDEHRFKRAMLQDKLVNLFADLDQRALKQSGYFKLIAGGDPIDAERKHQAPFTFKPFCKLVFSANKMPASWDRSPAFYRRWLIIPFPNTFAGADADPDKLAKITTPGELSGLLNKVITRLRTLEARRFFAEPDTVQAAMASYKLDSDSMVAFLGECCKDAEPGEYVSKKALYQAFGAWASEGNVKHIEPQAEFNRRLQEIYPTIQDRRVRTSDGKQPRVWYNGPVFQEQ